MIFNNKCVCIYLLVVYFDNTENEQNISWYMFYFGFAIEIIRIAISDELSYYLDKIDLYLLFIYQYDK